MDIVKKESMAMCKAEIADFAESLRPLLRARMRACACAPPACLPRTHADTHVTRTRTSATRLSREPLSDKHPDERLDDRLFVRRCAAANNIFVVFNCRFARSMHFSRAHPLARARAAHLPTRAHSPLV